jgi:cobalt-zinc-cadmium efflux system outer membrane protein
VFSPEEALRFALQNNPLLQVVRQQRGFAQGTVVIARTYPYNPIGQFQTFGAFGKDVTNNTPQVDKITLDVELCGQRQFRKQAAYAALSRTEWEIAAQEVATSVATIRAFNTVVYRQRKLYVLEDTVKLNEQVVDQVDKLVKLGRMRPADLIVARTELNTARAQMGQGHAALAVARADLRRQLGTVDDSFGVKGELDIPVPTTDTEVLTEAAREKRPDLQARRFAVAETQAQLGLQVANRYGPLNIGPTYELNETKSTFIGMQFGGQIPVFNTRRGEIIQARANYSRAQADARQFEILAAQDVVAALARLSAARTWVDSYTGDVLPNLKKAMTDMNTLLEQNDPGVDVVKIIGVQRNYLRAFDTYLDALMELSQARADLAAAIADPAMAVGLYAPCAKPAAPQYLPELPKDDQPEPEQGFFNWLLKLVRSSKQ